MDVPVLPYGEILGAERNYYWNDPYGDYSPLFNLSVIANIYLELDEADFAHVMNPQNTFDQEFVKTNLTFDNGNERIILSNVGLKLKGFYSRLTIKKAWSIKFGEFVSGMLC